MQNNDFKQKPNQNFQLKIGELQSKLDILMQHEQKAIATSADINNILMYLKSLQNQLDKNKLNVQFLEKTFNLQKMSLEVIISNIDKRVEENNVLLTDTRQKLNLITKQISDIKVHLVQNDGQTNQCYIGLDKLQKRLEVFHPINSIQSQANPQTIEKNIKKLFSRIIVGIIVVISISLGSYIGIKYWNKFIDDQYNNMHHQSQINTNGKK